MKFGQCIEKDRTEHWTMPGPIFLQRLQVSFFAHTLPHIGAVTKLPFADDLQKLKRDSALHKKVEKFGKFQWHFILACQKKICHTCQCSLLLPT